MKKIISLLFLLCLANLLSTNLFAQENNSRHKAFKEMKLNFILDKSDMNKEEIEHFQCVFGSFEDKYHSSVWIKERQIKKQIEKSYDTINSISASYYIEEYHLLEKLGISLRNERNQKLLEKISAREVLNILNREQLFDREMFKRIKERKNKNKKQGEKRR